MFRIRIEYVIREKNGKKYRIPYTYDFGYAMSVSVNGNINIQQDMNGYYIDYYAKNAEIKVNKDGYMVLHVTDRTYR